MAKETQDVNESRFALARAVAAYGAHRLRSPAALVRGIAQRFAGTGRG